MAQLICLLLAVIFAALATAGVPHPPRFAFLPFAIVMLALAFLVGGASAWHW